MKKSTLWKLKNLLTSLKRDKISESVGKWMMKIIWFQEGNFSFVMIPLKTNWYFLLHDKSIDAHSDDDSIKQNSVAKIHDTKDV